MTDWSTLPDDCTALISSHYRAKLHHRMMMRELSDTIQYMRRNHWGSPIGFLFIGGWDGEITVEYTFTNGAVTVV